MYVIVDERPMVTDGYVANFNREGVTSVGLVADDFEGWIQSAPETDLDAVQGFLLGNCEQRPDLPEMIQKRSRAPIIAMIETRCLTETLDLFRAGIDDVVRKPIHVREILARTEAVWRRSQRERASDSVVADRTARLRVYFDGRDPDVDGENAPAAPRTPDPRISGPQSRAPDDQGAGVQCGLRRLHERRGRKRDRGSHQ